jgi:hypothetical protein
MPVRRMILCPDCRPTDNLNMTAETKHNLLTTMLVCDHYLVEASGKPSFIGVFERITFESLPNSLTRFYLVAKVSRVDGNVLSIYVRHPDGTHHDLASTQVEDKQKASPNASFVWEVAGFPFLKAGRYLLGLMMDGEDMGSTAIEVESRKDKS